MLNKIKRFYRETILKEVGEVDNREPPITHIKVFYKEYPRFESIPLPGVNKESEFDILLEMRESQRVFSDKQIDFNDISKILLSCRVVDDKREPERRTYPSGGARFPIEVYLINFNIRNLNLGAYHYCIPKQKLEVLLKEDLRNRRRELISPYLENSAATIVFTAVIPRSEVKYGIRAYPYSLIEAGHMGQNMLLTATQAGIGACPVSGFVDRSVKRLLDLTRNEIPVYTISIGRRRFIS